MIDYIKGEIAELTPTYAVIDNHGVGYMLSISLNSYSALQNAVEAKLYVYEAIREDAYALYGFAETKKTRPKVMASRSREQSQFSLKTSYFIHIFGYF